MPRSDSGRVVVELGAEQKQELYACLAVNGLSLKEWLARTVKEYCVETREPSLFEVEPGRFGYPSPLMPGRKQSGQRYSVVSMFSGCGGMDLGFRGGFEVFGRRYAELPFDVKWANDVNEAACRTYKNNLGHDILCGDIWKQIDQMPTTSDVVIGGFPCQDISINGKRAGANGSRSGLYRAMVEAIKRTSPSVFVAENVKGLLQKPQRDSLEQVLSDFGGLGYSVSYRLYNAADYGVPQNRERVFIIGVKPDFYHFHPPVPERGSDTWMTSSEAISDLEKAEESPDFNHIWSRAKRSPEQGSRVISADRPAHTIRAECHGNIQWHYKLPRRLSMREAARLQSFPDDFIFASKLRETERQIGNAVPPVLAWHIARSVLHCLEGWFSVAPAGKESLKGSSPLPAHRPVSANS